MRLEETKERLAATGLRLKEERMQHLSGGRTLDRNSSSRIALAQAQATALFRHGRIEGPPKVWPVLAQNVKGGDERG